MYLMTCNDIHRFLCVTLNEMGDMGLDFQVPDNEKENKDQT